MPATDESTAVRIRVLSWADLVRRAEGENLNKPEPAYEFSNGKKFDTPSDGGGIYRPETS